MAIDWDAELLSPVMELFGEGVPADQSTWPLYTPAGGAAFRLADAVFDAAYADITINGDGSEVSTRKPVLGVRISLFLLGPPKQNDRVYIPAVAGTFIIKEPRPDGHGHALLIMQGPIP